VGPELTFVPTLGRSTTGVMPKARSSSGAPTPLSCKNAGLMIAPADTMTSRVAWTTARAPLPSAAPYSTPVARAASAPPSAAHTIFVAWCPGSTVSPGCTALVFAPAEKSGYRYALAEEERTEWLPTG
jgi:hypothetical protein